MSQAGAASRGGVATADGRTSGERGELGWAMVMGRIGGVMRSESVGMVPAPTYFHLFLRVWILTNLSFLD